MNRRIDEDEKILKKRLRLRKSEKDRRRERRM